MVQKLGIKLMSYLVIKFSFAFLVIFAFNNMTDFCNKISIDFRSGKLKDGKPVNLIAGQEFTLVNDINFVGDNTQVLYNFSCLNFFFSSLCLHLLMGVL